MQIIYVSVQGNNQILVGDYSEGMSANTIKWSIWTFPAYGNLACISMCTLSDGEFVYCLRMGFTGQNGLYKAHSGLLNDSGTAITWAWQSDLTSISQGGLDIFTALRLRAKNLQNGNLTVNLTLTGEDTAAAIYAPPALTVVQNPKEDYFRQINFMGEKMAIEVSGSGYGLNLNRLDIWGKNFMPARPQAGGTGV
jgi:hypothetical protein